MWKKIRDSTSVKILLSLCIRINWVYVSQHHKAIGTILNTKQEYNKNSIAWPYLLLPVADRLPARSNGRSRVKISPVKPDIALSLKFPLSLPGFQQDVLWMLCLAQCWMSVVGVLNGARDELTVLGSKVLAVPELSKQNFVRWVKDVNRIIDRDEADNMSWFV